MTFKVLNVTITSTFLVRDAKVVLMTTGPCVIVRDEQNRSNQLQLINVTTSFYLQGSECILVVEGWRESAPDGGKFAFEKVKLELV